MSSKKPAWQAAPVPPRGLRSARLRPPPSSSWRYARRVISWKGWGPTGKSVATIGTLATAIAAIGALVMTNRTLDATRQQTAVSEQGQYTDRFGRAVEQLGSDKINIRLGGIYALERLAGDSPRDATTITRLLGAYVRESMPCVTAPTPNARLPIRPATDVAATLTVLSMRDFHRTSPWADLTRACLDHLDFEGTTLANLDLYRARLTGTKLDYCFLGGLQLQETDLSDVQAAHSDWLGVYAGGARLTRVNLSGAALNGSIFDGADLTAANLESAFTKSYRTDGPKAYADATVPRPGSMGTATVFSNANLSLANFSGTNLAEGDFRNATLEHSDFTRSTLQNSNFADHRLPQDRNPAGEEATFIDADLSGANFSGRDMRRMILIDADLTGAELRGVDLRGVDLRRTKLANADLTDADLTGALR